MNSPLLTCLILLAFVMASCQSAPQQAQPAASLESAGWYVASEEPLTFCPKGYKLPGVQFGILDGEYVYLADRSSRFYIPTGTGAQYYRKQALVAREASFKQKNRFMGSVTAKITVVGNAIGAAVRRPMSLIGRD